MDIDSQIQTSVDDSNSGWNRLLTVCGLIMAAYAWMLRFGYRFGVVNHPIQVPMFKSWIDPTLYAGDAMIATRPGFTTTYYQILSQFVSETSQIPFVYFAMQLVSIFVALAGLFALGRSLGKGSLAGWLTILIAMLPPPILAEARVLLSTHSHAEPAFALQIWALVAFLNRRPALAFGMLGLAFNIHALNSAYLVVCLGPALLLEPALRRSILRSGIAFAICAQPVLTWLVMSSGSRPQPEWFQHMRVRSAWHSYPWEWEKFSLILVAYIVWLTGGAIAYRFVRSELEAFHRRICLVTASAVTIMCFAGWIFAEVVPVASVLKAQLFRSTLWLNTIAGPIIAAGCVEFARRGLARRGAVGQRFAAFQRSPRFAALALCFTAIIVILGFPSLYAASRLPDESKADWLAVQSWARENTRKDDLFLTPPGDEGFRIQSERGVFLEWKDGTQQYFDFEFSSMWWERLHRIARIEPELTEFSYKAAHIQRINGGYFALPTDELLEIARRNRLSYLVFDHSRRLPLNRVYSNDAYVVYDLRHRDSSAVASVGTK